MNKNNVNIAKAYYGAMSKKNINDVEKYLHADVQFSAPLAKVTGKKTFLESITKFISFFKTLTIRAQFGSDDQAIVVYDVDFPAPIGMVPTVALMNIQNGLITKIELFYDARPFEKKSN